MRLEDQHDGRADTLKATTPGARGSRPQWLPDLNWVRSNLAIREVGLEAGVS